MSTDRIDLLINHFRVGNLLDQRIREVALKVSLGEAEAWILVAMSGVLDRHPSGKAEARSCVSVASQLGYSRERVAMRLNPLCAKGLLEEVSVPGALDRRRREYQITKKGQPIAAQLFSMLCELERDVRFNAGFKVDARTVDARRMAGALWFLGDARTIPPAWLDQDE